MEALGRPNIGEAEPTHPQGSEMGHLGYGPPLPPPPPDPQAGFREEYGGSDRVSPTPSNNSQASTSWFLTSIHKSLHRLICATAVLDAGFEGKGRKIIGLNLAELKLQRKELDQAASEAHCRGDLPEEVQEEVDNILEATSALERKTAMAQEALEAQERLDRADLSQRPKVRFNKFKGQPKDFDVFERDTAKIMALYPDPEQQILQIASICGDHIDKIVLRYLNSGPRGPQDAIDNLRSKFGNSHMIKPVLIQRLKAMKTGANHSQVPETAESICFILEALRAMDTGDEQYLPQDATASVLRALRKRSSSKPSLCCRGTPAPPSRRLKNSPRSKDNDVDDEKDNVNAICLYRREKGKKHRHWISKWRIINSHSKGELKKKNSAFYVSTARKPTVSISVKPF